MGLGENDSVDGLFQTLNTFQAAPIFDRNFEGETPYFCMNVLEKYSRLLNPEEKQICVIGSVVVLSITSAFFNLTPIRKLFGE